MKKILIVSATSGSNLILANKIGELFGVKNEIITLEDYELPLYSRKIKLEDQAIINDLCERLLMLMVSFSVALNIMVDLPQY